MNVAAILKSKGRAVATARSDTSLLEISKTLAEKKIGAILIVDSGKLSGIISERDVIRALGEHGPDALQLPVQRVMTKAVITCTETSIIEELMETMTKGRFRHIPVMEGDQLVGIVSIGDVVKNHIAEVEMEVTAMRGYLATG
jgi:CBS domain-containing protein